MQNQKNGKNLFIFITTTVLVILLLFAWVWLGYYQLNKIIADDRLVESATKFIAHRGFSELYMENTIDAYNAACKSDFFQGLETDIWQTLDGVFVCSHDSNPFSDKNIDITTSNYNDIKNLALDTSSVKYDIDKTKTYHICTLKEYLHACKVSSKYALIELKQQFSSEQIDELLRFVKDKINFRDVFWASFHKKNIELVYKKAPYYKVMLFTRKSIRSTIYANIGYNIGISHNVLTPKTIQKAHKNNSYAFVYTLTTKQEVDKFVAMKVDFIICDGVIS